jgi:hypothetical protein
MCLNFTDEVDHSMYRGEKEQPAVNRCNNRIASYDFTSQSGASLLIIVISILVLAVLATAMYSITSTSFYNQVSAQAAMKALYLAESGPRIVASEYKAATAANKNTKLANLNGQTFNIYPYWLYAPAALASSTSITLNLPGDLPRQDKEGTAVITFPTRGILKVSGLTEVRIFTGTSAAATTASGTPITFTLSSAFPSTYYPIPINSELLIGFVQNDSGANSIFSPAQQMVSQGGNLILNTTGNIATFFPPENGTFSLALGSGIFSYHYDKRDNVLNSGKTTLTNVQSACPASTVCPPYPAMSNFTVIYDSANLLDPIKTTQIYVGKSLGIRSTGLYGN